MRRSLASFIIPIAITMLALWGAVTIVDSAKIVFAALGARGAM